MSVMALTAPNTLRKPLNVLVTGAAGSGKTSTIDALFKARDGHICLKTFSASSGMTRYDFGGLVVWECPGLGGDEANEEHNVHVLRQLLGERDKDGRPLIDLALLLVDASRRDLGTTFDLLNQVLIPSFEACEHRLVVALNQADLAMKGRHWDFDAGMPLPPLREFLDEKAASLARRLHENTGLHCAPIYYSAGFKRGRGEAEPVQPAAIAVDAGAAHTARAPDAVQGRPFRCGRKLEKRRIARTGDSVAEPSVVQIVAGSANTCRGVATGRGGHA